MVVGGGEHQVIENYLNETTIWKRVTGLNEYGEPVTESKEIKIVPWEGGHKLVRDAQGREVVSVARTKCVEPVQVGDLLQYEGRDWPVLASNSYSFFNGVRSHREVAV